MNKVQLLLSKWKHTQFTVRDYHIWYREVDIQKIFEDIQGYIEGNLTQLRKELEAESPRSQAAANLKGQIGALKVVLKEWFQ